MTRGYIRVLAPEHPAADPTTGYVLEHRLVAERMLGRLLLPTEVVHHRDGDKSNNDPANLEVMTNPDHTARHSGLRGRWARHHDRCARCGTTDRGHEAHGLCWRCYQKRRDN